MSDQLAQAHIAAEARLRAIAGRAVASVWASLPGYDKVNVDEWLTRVLPIVEAAQRQSVTVTAAYLARALASQPIGVNVAELVGAGPRNGAAPEDVYQRPFVTLWSALGAGTDWERAVAEGLTRAVAAAQTDVQLSMRHTLRAVGSADDRILGYRRVPDSSACKFCRRVAGQRYVVLSLMPIHPHCGCGAQVITAGNRGDFTGNPKNDLKVDVVVHEHGELGPVLADAAHHFAEV